MRLSFRCLLFFGLILSIAPLQLYAQYNPARDNPYIRPNANTDKKWYEFTKKRTSSPYISKDSGYWSKTDQENFITRGAKSVLSGISDIVKLALS